MATGKIKSLFPPGNNGARHGAGQIIEDETGTKYVFQTPDDVDPTISLGEGTAVTFDVVNGKSIGNVRLSVPLPTCAFSADPTAFNAGDTVILSWGCRNASVISIDNGIGNVRGPEGSIAVIPTATTTYTLTAANSAGQTVSVSVQVTLNTVKPI
jgi:hypothetical protein